MANESNAALADKINNEIDNMFQGVSSVTKEKLKQAIEVCRKNCATNSDVSRSGTAVNCPITNDLKKKMCQLLETELDKMSSNTISKEQAKNICACLCHSPNKDSNFSPREQHFQSALKEQFNKLNTQQISATQARDMLRNIRQEMRPPHMNNRSEMTMIDDRVKDDFLNDFKAKFGTNKVSAEEVWDMLKSFDKKHHEKTHESFQKDKEKKWDEMFNEQVQELFGDPNKINLNQQQVEELAKTVREKIRADCTQHPGKRFCQH